jgi:hypothetical protein
MRSSRLATLACALLGASPALVRAEVVGVDIETQTDAWNGATFGDVGAYEFLTGRIRFAIDPNDPHNRIIQGLDGGNKVAFSADFQILRPKDPVKGNGTLLLDVVNRGMKTVDSFRRTVPGGDDGFLMRRGFTVVWVGWEFDLRSPSVGMRIIVPRSRGSRCAVRGAMTPTLAALMTASFDDLSGYTSSDAAANATLSVRDGLLGEPTPLARAHYKLERFNFVTLQDGFRFTAGRTYELSYDVVDPPVGGLGFAAVRDAVSWLRSAPDSNVKVQRTLAFGSSQSGRFLRTFLYLGFNADERGRKVFDGVMAHIAGASRLDLNRPCATPTSLGQFDATSFPFADAALHDPVTGIEEGALDNPRARDFEPKIFYTNTGVEYWGGARSAALIHTTPDGEQDLRLPDNERVYFLTGSQHGPARFPPDGSAGGAQRENPNDYWLTMRALLVAMEEWLRDGKAPPPSLYPLLRDKTLVRSADVAFPALPGVHALQGLPIGRRAPNGLLARDGAGTALPYLVPQTDRDGIELAGVRLPEIEVPLATYTGWNFRNPGSGGADQLYPLLGSYIPFPATADARAAVKDPRTAIAERYASKQDYLDKVRAAADKLVAERYLLAEDVPQVVERAGRHWDLLTK